MKKTTLATLFVCVLALLTSPAFSVGVDPEILKGMKARSIGPANMSGRIGAIDAVAADPNIIYVGAAAGGVWKSEDRGVTWKPVFDDQPVSSIGAIAVNQANPNIVWVGTGEAAPRNSVSVGRGVFQSIDGGRTWKCLGLEKTDKISDIVLDQRDPDIAYVGALGPTWSDSAERGVYKTADRGKTWEKILYVNERTGVANLVMDPRNPNKMLAAMWEHRRQPWFFTSGGPGSGLYLTLDAGKTWRKLTDKEGLPKGDLGRIGMAFAPSRPEIAYALVEAKKSVLLRSSDGGFTWTTINDQANIDNRPFYYSRIWVNPKNENILFYLNTQLSCSEDGGKTFRPLTGFGQAHSDHHALWIHPDGEMLVAGNDGGVVISNNRGRTWQFVTNLPIGQFYHVNTDMEFPYNLYGGLQDNGTWRGPGYTLTDGMLYSYLWKNVGGGDGFDAAADPEDSKSGYGMSQGGNLYYFNTVFASSRAIVPTESDVKHRFHWNAGFAIDPFKPATIYLGSQFVHRSRDKGRSWEIISTDLTTNDPAKQKQSESGGLTLDVSSAENHTCITTIAPSPLQEGLIWVGTDDGNIQLSRDAGKAWELVSKPLYSGKKPLVPPFSWVTHLEPSKFDPATAYAVIDDHRRGNWATYVLVTRDFGKTWKNLATPDIDGFAYCLEEDTADRNILFVGTEFGLFFSLDGGSSWQKWTAGIPTTPVHDLIVHPRESDLLIATHGRSFYVIDDITLLREIADTVAKKKLHIFKPQSAFQFQTGRMTSFMSPGDSAFVGENKPGGACITYYLLPTEKKEEEQPESQPQAQAPEARQRMMGFAGVMGQFAGFMRGGSTRVRITFTDKDGKFVAQMNGTENKGINRVYWNMRETMAPREGQAEQREEMSEAAGFFRRSAGISVLPGIYTVKIKYDDQEASQTIEVKTDPRIAVNMDILKEKYTKVKAAGMLVLQVTEATRRLTDTRKALQTLFDFARVNRSPKTAELVKAGRELDNKAKTLQEELNPTPAKQGMADRSTGLSSQVSSSVFGMSGSPYEPITQAAAVRYEKAKAKAEAFMKKLNAFYATDVENFKKLYVESGFSLFGSTGEAPKPPEKR